MPGLLMWRRKLCLLNWPSEVKKEKKVASELLGSMRKVTRFTSFFILPLGVLLFLEAYFLRNTQADAAIVSTAAALLGMLPKGWFS